MKFIHCSDMHLDSRMESNLSEKQAKERRMEIFETFAAMVDYARGSGVRAVIIAGDMFDTKNSHTRIKKRVRALIEENPEIDFLYLKGNHDNADFLVGEKCPDNLKFFGRSWTRYSYGGADIVGSENGADEYGSLELDKARVNIVVMHGAVSAGNSSVDYPINISAFANRHIDYMALGHIHSYKCEKLDERGEYCYCGCLEGRGFDECGDKGFVLLDADENGVKHKFIPFAKRRLHSAEVNIDGAASEEEVIGMVNAAVSGIPPEDMVKIVLTGGIGENVDIDAEYLRRRYENSFYFVKLYDRSSVSVDYERYKNDISLKGEFIRLVSELKTDEERKRQIIMTGIKALAGREIDI